MSMIIIKNEAGDFAEDKDTAARLREEVIRPIIKSQNIVELEFSGVSLVTQSFVHALLSDILRSGGEDTLDFILFTHCNDSIKGIISTVVQYSLDSLESE